MKKTPLTIASIIGFQKKSRVYRIVHEWLYVADVLLFIGAGLPWVYYLGTQRSGLESDGLLTFGIAIGLLLYQIIGPHHLPTRLGQVVELVLGMLIIGLSWYHFADIEHVVGYLGTNGSWEMTVALADGFKASAGEGLYMTLAGGVVLFCSGVYQLFVKD